MRIWRFEDSARAMFLDDIPQPQPGPDEVLNRIWAAGVTPTDCRGIPSPTRKGVRDEVMPCRDMSSPGRLLLSAPDP